MQVKRYGRRLVVRDLTRTRRPYNYFRDYDPAIGRYVQRFRLGYSGELTPTLQRYWSFLVCVALTMAGALAADYPVRPIRIVVPQSPGGTTDFTARLVAPRLSERI